MVVDGGLPSPEPKKIPLVFPSSCDLSLLEKRPFVLIL